jgi:hypothetical protein
MADSADDPQLTAFVAQVGELASRSAAPAHEQVRALRCIADAMEEIGVPVSCRSIPFHPGRRPTDETEYPGLGSSDASIVRLDSAARHNTASVLYEVGPLPQGATVEADVSIEGPAGPPSTLAGWDSRPLEVDPSRHRQRIDIPAQSALEGHDLGFTAGLLRRATVAVRVRRSGQLLAADETHLDVCDIDQLGRLYDRIVERVLVPDTAVQAIAAGTADPGVAFHPWFPVLNIGRAKAALYTEAIVGDIVDKAHFLGDPGWLLRVGIYLELLTGIGIAEAVRDDVGDILDDDEREAFERSPVYEQIRRRVDPAAWREVWRLRSITFARRGMPRTGPVSAANLLAKRRSTMAFLHAHHEDLKHAIELAGPNQHDAQEAWHRVFRDAERAVLRQMPASFPELAYLPAPMREIVLWQRRGTSEQQGLYATACVQYRASMNDVAAWGRARGLMDYTGTDCVPESASLLHAHMHRPQKVASLQRGDGYGPTLDLTPLRQEAPPTISEIAAMVASAELFAALDESEAAELARRAQPLLLAPHERLVRHGDQGDSLFLVGDGHLDVVVRSTDGEDTYVEPVGSGEIVGEMSFLTGQPRAATLRAGEDGAMVFEITREAFDRLAEQHPGWRDDLAKLKAQRLSRRREILRGRSAASTLRGRIRGWRRRS